MKPTQLLSVRKNATAYACLFFVLFAVLPAKAQRPRIGIKLGTAVTNCTIESTEPAIETSVKPSVTAGIFLHVPLKRRFSIRPSVEFVFKGAIINKKYNSYTSMREYIRFSYLDIPVNFLYDLPLGPNKFFVGGGPVISFLLNKNANPGAAGNDLGANVLAGFEWPIGAAFMVNYTHGFKNVSAGRYNETIKNYYIGITLGYWF
jgi:hypothetical protein